MANKGGNPEKPLVPRPGFDRSSRNSYIFQSLQSNSRKWPHSKIPELDRVLKGLGRGGCDLCFLALALCFAKSMCDQALSKYAFSKTECANAKKLAFDIEEEGLTSQRANISLHQFVLVMSEKDSCELQWIERLATL
jgi:hypothetical protein